MFTNPWLGGLARLSGLAAVGGRPRPAPGPGAAGREVAVGRFGLSPCRGSSSTWEEAGGCKHALRPAHGGTWQEHVYSCCMEKVVSTAPCLFQPSFEQPISSNGLSFFKIWCCLDFLLPERNAFK